MVYAKKRLTALTSSGLQACTACRLAEDAPTILLVEFAARVAIPAGGIRAAGQLRHLIADEVRFVGILPIPIIAIRVT